MARRSLETLPAEVLLEIGTHLDKPSTLLTFMCISSRLYAFVSLHQETLVTKVLANLVTPELLPQAIAVFEASKVESWTPERTTHTISQFKGSRYIQRARLSVKDGLNIQKRHEQILPAINHFVECALRQHPKVLVEPKPLSKNERLRVERSFYRFELCTNIFRQHILDENPTCERCETCKERTRSSVNHVILFLFSDTDLEQMVIITEFVQERKHRYGMKWEWDITRAWGNPTTSKAWAKWVVSFFATPILEQNNSPHKHDTLNLESTDATEDSLTEVKSLIVASYGGLMPPDTDEGPRNASRWAKKFMKNSNLQRLITLEHRRDWGYALWDERRLQDEWGLFKGVETPRK